MWGGDLTSRPKVPPSWPAIVLAAGNVVLAGASVWGGNWGQAFTRLTIAFLFFLLGHALIALRAAAEYIDHLERAVSP